MSDEGVFDFLLDDLHAVPYGSLLLVAHHKPEERAGLLTALCFAAVEDHQPVRWISLTELPSMAVKSVQAKAAATYDNWASHAAREAIPDADYPHCDGSQEDRAKRDKKYHEEQERAKTKRAQEREAMFSDYCANWRESVDDGNLSVEGMPGHSMDSLVATVNQSPGTTFIIIDDISALRRDAKKPPSPKQCGEHARVLKELALEHELIVCAGMPAPIVHTKEYGRVSEHSIGLSDLAGYGSPNESADIVYTFHPGGRSYQRILLAHRYKASSR